MDTNVPIPPSRTLYVRNLPDKLPKQRLRRLLHAKFSAHGRVVWIVAEKTMKLRGQAFITFDQQTGATAALRALQSGEFMGRAMSIAYARQVTDRANAQSFGGNDELSRSERDAQRRQRKQCPPTAENQLESDQPMQEEENAVIPPNNILFVENLPTTKQVENEKGELVSTQDLLSELFARFSGFVEVRSVPTKHDIAFVEFTTDGEAAIAMSGLDQRPVGSPPGRPMSVNFAKK